MATSSCATGLVPAVAVESCMSGNAGTWSPVYGIIIGTGISLWRYLAQSQVNSQTHAERRIIYLFTPVYGIHGD